MKVSIQSIVRASATTALFLCLSLGVMAQSVSVGGEAMYSSKDIIDNAVNSCTWPHRQRCQQQGPHYPSGSS